MPFESTVNTLSGHRCELGKAFRTYYADPDVRQRIVDYLGGRSLETATCHYIAHYADDVRPWFRPRPVGRLWEMLDRRHEVERSVWDRASLLAHLDVEYVHFDQPWLPYADPSRAFELQHPVLASLRDILATAGIAPLELLSGRGFHLVWRVPIGSAAFRSLASIGTVAVSTRRLYEAPHRPNGARVELELGRAYAGLGLVMESVAHRVLDRSASTSPIPIQLTATEVGRGSSGREIISIDLSEYGDPIHRRTIRIPFGAYLKAYRLNEQRGTSAARSTGPLVMIPLGGLEPTATFRWTHDLDRARQLARHASTRIPNQAHGMQRLIEHYLRTELATLHRQFYAQEHDPPDHWPDTYDQLRADSLPPCVQYILENPNDWLLRPVAIQHVVRALMSLGWHPRHIAGLLRSKYERDHGWLKDRHFHDSAMRADFYTRLFSSLIRTGRDRLIDFNCRSTQEREYCRAEGCRWNLEHFRDSLLARCSCE